MRIIYTFLFLANILYADFITEENSVIDRENHLQWLMKSDISEDQRVWKSANSFCKSTTSLGYSDWRLPSVKELQTLVKIYQKSMQLKKLDASVYWSKEEDHEEYDVNAFEVYIANGHASSADKCDVERFICVRKYIK